MKSTFAEETEAGGQGLKENGASQIDPLSIKAVRLESEREVKVVVGNKQMMADEGISIEGQADEFMREKEVLLGCCFNLSLYPVSRPTISDIPPRNQNVQMQAISESQKFVLHWTPCKFSSVQFG